MTLDPVPTPSWATQGSFKTKAITRGEHTGIPIVAFGQQRRVPYAAPLQNAATKLCRGMRVRRDHAGRSIWDIRRTPTLPETSLSGCNPLAQSVVDKPRKLPGGTHAPSRSPATRDVSM